MTPQDYGVVAVSVKISQVGSSLIVADVMLPTLRARGRFKDHGGVVFPCVNSVSKQCPF